MAAISDQLKLNLEEADDSSLKLKDVDMSSLSNREFPSSSLIKLRSSNIKQLLIPRHSLETINHSQKGNFKSPFSNCRLSLNQNTFDQAFKNNMIQFLDKEEKRPTEIRFLKKHFSTCNFFKNYAIPLGDDVFEQCLQKLRIIEFSQNTYLINKGSAIKSRHKVQRVEENLYTDREIVLFTPQIQIQKQFSIQLQQQQANSPLTPQNSHQVFSYQSSQCSSPSSSALEQNKLFPISSILEQQFVQKNESQYFIYNNEDCIYAYLSSSDFAEAISNSKNSELISNLTGLKQSQFLCEWPIVKLKPILSQSTVQTFIRNQNVYKQGDPSSFWEENQFYLRILLTFFGVYLEQQYLSFTLKPLPCIKCFQFFKFNQDKMFLFAISIMVESIQYIKKSNQQQILNRFQQFSYLWISIAIFKFLGLRIEISFYFNPLNLYLFTLSLQSGFGNILIYQSIFNCKRYLVLDGEFEYQQEILIDNEINDIVKACLDSVSHQFKKQTMLTDENQKGKSILRVSILQKGEIFGIEDLIPKQDRRYTVKCISNVGQVRQINEQYVIRLLSRNNEETKKVTSLAQQKNAWLERATEEKLPMNQQIHKTILDSKRNRTLFMIKQKEEIKEQEILNIQSQSNSIKTNTMNGFDLRKQIRNNLMTTTSIPNQQVSQIQGQSLDNSRDILGLADTPKEGQPKKSILINQLNTPQSKFSIMNSHNQKNTGSVDLYLMKQQKSEFSRSTQIKTPIILLQPEKSVSFIKRVDQVEKNKSQIDKELSLERRQLKEAKEDLLSQYRISIERYFSEANQKLYKRVEKKKIGVDLYLNQRKEQGDSLIQNRSSKTENESLAQKQKPKFSLKFNHKRDEDEMVQSQDFSLKLSDRHGQRVKSEYTSITPALPQNITQPILKATFSQQDPQSLISSTTSRTPVKQQNRLSLVTSNPITIVSPRRNFSQHLAMDYAYNSFYNNLIKKTNETQQAEQLSPLLSITKKLYLPSKTKKMLLNQNPSNQQSTPSSSILEKFNISTQASFFKKGNDILEQIINAKTQQIQYSQQQRRLSNQKNLEQNSDSFQVQNKSPTRLQLKSDLEVIQDIKQKISYSHRRSSSSNK